MERLPLITFSLPVLELRRGYYSGVYFWRAKKILEAEGVRKKGLIQVFNKVDGGICCGIDEALAILRLGTGYWKEDRRVNSLFDRYIELKSELRSASMRNNFKEIESLTSLICEIRHELNSLWVDTHKRLRIRALRDGDKSKAFEPVLTIEGQASDYIHLESIYLGVLSRATKIATNTKKVVEAANGKPVLFFCDRFDRWSNQVADGYAAMKSGASGVATNAMGKWWGIGGFGTIPHILIALFEGNTPEVTLCFQKHYPNLKTIALVDFHNDCVQTSLEVAKRFRKAGKKLWGVRLDTSGTMVDQSIIKMMGQFNPTGVCFQLVENVRKALDQNGFEETKIVVSGGFNPDRIQTFEKKGISVDAYGVGSFLLSGNCDYTADSVLVNNKPIAKAGRKYQPSKRLKNFDWSEIE